MANLPVGSGDIERFLAIFDGDAVQAVRAIREYVGAE